MFWVFFTSFLFSDAVLSLVTDKEYSMLPPVFKMDDFDRCMLLGDDAQYCTINFQLEPADVENPTEIWQKIMELSKDPKNYRHDRLRHGICVPFSCPNISTDTREDLEKCYSRKYEKYGVVGTITEIHCQKNESPSYDIYDISIILVISVYSALLLFASYFYGSRRTKEEQNRTISPGSNSHHPKNFHAFIRHFEPGIMENILSCFSIPKNWHRLTQMKETPDTEALRGIQGLRFWNMFVVLGSHALMVTLHGPIVNTKFIEETMNSTSINFLAGLTPIVTQTFFLISFWLLTYHVLRGDDKKQLSISNFPIIILNRYMRLTPPLAAILAINTTLPKYIVKGPFWYHMIGREYESCRENGWSNLLYINNYVNPTRMCMSQTWYLATDMQLYVLGLCVLVLLKKYPERTLTILGISLALGISIPGILCFVFGYDIIHTYPEVLYTVYLTSDYWHVLFSSGYSNIGALIIGICSGYLFFTHRDKTIFNTKIRKTMIGVISGGICFTAAITMIFMNRPQYEYSRLNAAFWWSGTKNALCIAAAVFIFGMTEKVGGIFLSICWWRPVRYLSRLTYSAFLVHSFLLRVKAASMRSPTYINSYIFVTSNLEIVTVSYIFGLILCLTCEMPISALQKIWSSKSEKQVDKAAKKILKDN